MYRLKLAASQVQQTVIAKKIKHFGETVLQNIGGILYKVCTPEVDQIILSPSTLKRKAEANS